MLATAGIVAPGLDDQGGSAPPAAPAETTGQETVPEVAHDHDAFEASEAEGISLVLRAIASGEPLPYEEDGQTFQNREGLLPQHPLGYYREYTVETPGSPDRGARRLVIGDAGETYYTRDHYASFIRIEDPESFGP